MPRCVWAKKLGPIVMCKEVQEYKNYGIRFKIFHIFLLLGEYTLELNLSRFERVGE